MRITPLDIERKRFTVRWLRGFDVTEVYLFLEIVREEMEDLLRKNAESMEKLRIAESQILQYKAMESTLRDTIATAQQMADEITANARKEADLKMTEAGVEAANILRSAVEQVRTMNDEIVQLSGLKRHFKEELKRLIESTRSILNHDEVREGHHGQKTERL
jgi:cell division initiation protein